MSTFSLRSLTLAATFVAASTWLGSTSGYVAPAAASDSLSVDAIAQCMRRNVADRGALRQLELTVTDREGKTRTLAMKLYWKPAGTGTPESMTLQVNAPADVAGTAYLVRSLPSGDEVFTYLPALKTVRKIVGGDATQPLWGTDFTYAEIAQVQGNFQSGTTRRLADADVDGRAAYVLNTDTDVARSGYDSILSYVDQKTCTLLKAELLASDGRTLKVLSAEVDSLVQVEPYWLMLRYTMRDIGKGSKTALSLSDVFLKENLSDGLFTPESFFHAEP